MTTARDILQLATSRADESLREVFGKGEPFIRFASGQSATIENETATLMKTSPYDPFPLVAMFTEGVKESIGKGVLEFTVPKIAIVIRTLSGTDEGQKMEASFRNVLHPILEEFERQLRRLHFGYGLKVAHTDLPCMSNGGRNASLNQLCDAVIIRDLKMKVMVKTC